MPPQAPGSEAGTDVAVTTETPAGSEISAQRNLGTETENEMEEAGSPGSEIGTVMVAERTPASMAESDKER